MQTSKPWIDPTTNGTALPRILATLIAAAGVWLALGATWTGMTTVGYREMLLSGIMLAGVVWGVVRFGRGHPPIKRTAIDGALILWGLAFTVSTSPNLDQWRRIAIGLWFVGLYIGLWYMLHDVLTMWRIRRAVITDGLLIAGLPVMYLVYGEAVAWFTQDFWPNLPSGTGIVQLTTRLFDALPRVRGPLDNPNPLATVALILVFVAVGRWFSVRGWFARSLVGIYVVLIDGVLFLTQTRGAWLGAGVAGGVLSALVITHYRIKVQRFALVVLAGAVVTAGLAVTAARGWGGDGREIIYSAAITLFGEAPVTGHGLYTFGHGLLRVVGVIPNQTTHAHAHSLPLNIAAELGIAGLVALAASVWVLGRAMWRNVRVTGQPAELVIVFGAVAACVGVGIHHLVDVTALLPAVGMVCMVVLALAAAPLAEDTPIESPTTPPKRLKLIGRTQTMSAIIGGIILTGLGMWDTAVYGQFRAAIDEYLATGDALSTRARMAEVAHAEPDIPLYLAYHAYFLDKVGETKQAAQVYDALCAIEPNYQPPPNDNQIAILHYLRFGPLRLSDSFEKNYRCPTKP